MKINVPLKLKQFSISDYIYLKENNLKFKVLTRTNKNVTIISTDVINSDPVAYIVHGKEDLLETCDYNGVVNKDKTENDNDLFLKVPSVFTITYGDIVKDSFGNLYVFDCIKRSSKGLIIKFSYCLTNSVFLINNITKFNIYYEFKLASKDECQKLINSLKQLKSKKSKHILECIYLNKEYSKQKESFSFKDLVLCRNSESETWVPAEFAFYKNNYYTMIGGNKFKQCILYSKYKQYMGTTKNISI